LYTMNMFILLLFKLLMSLLINTETHLQLDLFNPAHTNTAFENIENVSERNGGKQGGITGYMLNQKVYMIKQYLRRWQIHSTLIGKKN